MPDRQSGSDASLIASTVFYLDHHQANPHTQPQTPRGAELSPRAAPCAGTICSNQAII